jgi:WXG100 family type VII secretion target
MASGKWDSETIRELGRKVGTGAEQIQSACVRMTGDLSATQGQWQGEARDQFDMRFEDWRRAASQLKDALDGMSGFLGTAASTYEDVELRLKQGI